MRLSTLLSTVFLIKFLIHAEVGLSQDYIESVPSAQISSTASLPNSSVHVPQIASNNKHIKSDKNNLAAFTTDGCSMWMDGTMNQPWLWRHCCVAHDRAYWIGGTAAERRKSDQELQQCINHVAGKVMANSMYMGVVPGGSPYWVTPYRWGYGWNYFDAGKLRGYKRLNDEEWLQVNERRLGAEETIKQDAIDHPADFKIPERN